MQELFCNTTNKIDGQGESATPTEPVHTSRARIWPFGDGYISQLAPLYGKPDKRGQHAKKNHGPALTVVQDNGKAAHEHRRRRA